MPTTSSTTPMDITRAVVASFDRCESERLRQIMESLAAHLHAFATEVELTEGEWEAGSGSSRDGPHHGRPPAGVHSVVRRSRSIDAH